MYLISIILIRKYKFYKILSTNDQERGYKYLSSLKKTKKIVKMFLSKIKKLIILEDLFITDKIIYKTRKHN